jgi:hypothetical protein
MSGHAGFSELFHAVLERPKSVRCTAYSHAMLDSVDRVDGLYCKRPIQCLVSLEILTPPPTPSPPGECTLRLCCGGRTHSLGGEGVGRQ